MSTLMKRNGVYKSPSVWANSLTRDLLNELNILREDDTLPEVNIQETNDDFRVEMAAPGLRKEDFHIELDDDTLTIWSEVTDDNQAEEQNNYIQREFSYRSFKRSFHLPNTVETTKIEAKYHNGLLSMVIPKKEDAKRKPVKTIPIL